MLILLLVGLYAWGGAHASDWACDARGSTHVCAQSLKPSPPVIQPGRYDCPPAMRFGVEFSTFCTSLVEP